MRIVVKKGTQYELAEKFGVSVSVVSEALRFRRDNVKQREIRSYACNFKNGALVNV